METLRDDQYLEIRSVNEDDAGIYTCVAQNSAGKAKQNLEFQILGEFRSRCFSSSSSSIDRRVQFHHVLQMIRRISKPMSIQQSI